MGWSVRQYENKQYNAAAKEILHKNGTDISYEIVNNWRAAHAFPLNTFQARLRTKARSFDKTSTVAQRTKRLSSIIHKLDRFPNMKLTQIQDIGGCRAIVNNIKSVRSLVDEYKRSGIKHSLMKENDYITAPKASGYRGVHLIYSYVSDKNNIYNGLKIEIQIRSSLQHAWATAVETVGTFTSQSLKSSQGQEDWLRFFKLMRTVIALTEKSPIVPETASKARVIRAELKWLENRLKVISNLSHFGATLRHLEELGTDKNSHYFIISLEMGGGISMWGFPKNELAQASAFYLERERKAFWERGTNVVMVSADSAEALRRAYPNYFLDTNIFRDIVRDFI